MNILEFFALVISGFTACAEFASYAFVHPVIRHLPEEHHVTVEKGFLKTFGRAMPLLMTSSILLTFFYAFNSTSSNVNLPILRWGSAGSFVAALIFTLAFNVPINKATVKWDPENSLGDWKKTRKRWEFFQALRAWLLLTGFVLLCTAVTLNVAK